MFGNMMYVMCMIYLSIFLLTVGFSLLLLSVFFPKLKNIANRIFEGIPKLFTSKYKRR